VPDGRVGEVVMAMPVPTVRLNDCSALRPRLSVTRTTKFEVPLATGVPVRAPPVERFRPLGSEPEVSAQEYGAEPPVAASACV